MHAVVIHFPYPPCMLCCNEPLFASRFFLVLCLYLQSLLSAIQTTNAYTQVHYKKSLPMAITESNYKLSSTEVADKSTHFYNRTFPLVLSTFALLRSPDSILSRLIFDYKVG